MARVLLVDVGVSDSVPSRPFPNVGLAYLVSSLNQAGHEVHLLDLHNSPLSNDEIGNNVRTFSPHIIGISVKTATLVTARRIGKLLKKLLPSVPIVVGGPHAMVSSSDLAGEPWVNSVVAGEGEEVFPQLCATVCQGESLPSIITPSLIKSLDSLPLPDFSLFPPNVLETLKYRYPLVTSRGCVYDCIYCSVPRVSGRRFRPRRPEAVLAELEGAANSYDVAGFEIIDDAFNLDVRRAKDFCHLLARSPRQFFWSCPNGIRADLLDAELSMLMASTDCRQVMVGVESSVPEVLAGLRKGETIEDIERGIQYLQQAGIDVGGYFLIGAPGDTLELQLRNVFFIQRHRISAHFNILVPYPGTDLWAWVSEHGNRLAAPEQALHFSDSVDDLLIPFETHGFSASDRIHAYELVHTKIRRFNLLIPASVPFLRRCRLVIGLLWKHDRAGILSHVASSACSLALKMLSTRRSRDSR